MSTVGSLLAVFGKNTFLALVQLSIAIWLTCLLTLASRKFFLPASVGHKVPLHYSFTTCEDKEGACSFPEANVSIFYSSAASRRPLFEQGVSYTLSVEIVLPDTRTNREMGMIQIVMTFISKSGVVLDTVRRTAIYPYQMYVIRWIKTLLFLPLILVDWRAQNQTILVDFLSDFAWNPRSQLGLISCRIESRRVQIYDSNFLVNANLSGISYLMYYWPIFTTLVVFSAIFASLLSLISLFWMVKSAKLLSTSISNSIPKLTLQQDSLDQPPRGLTDDLPPGDPVPQSKTAVKTLTLSNKYLDNLQKLAEEKQQHEPQIIPPSLDSLSCSAESGTPGFLEGIFLRKRKRDVVITMAGPTAHHYYPEGLEELLFEGQSALEGVSALLSCDFDEARSIFGKERKSNPFLAAGYCCTLVMKHLTSFEEEDKQKALVALREAEHAFSSDSGIFRSRVEQTLCHCLKNKEFFHEVALHHLDILTADCYLYQALISVLSMELSGYLKAGWLIRKAWRLYDATYCEVNKLYEVYCPLTELVKSSASPQSEQRGRCRSWHLNRDKSGIALFKDSLEVAKDRYYADDQHEVPGNGGLSFSQSDSGINCNGQSLGPLDVISPNNDTMPCCSSPPSHTNGQTPSSPFGTISPNNHIKNPVLVYDQQQKALIVGALRTGVSFGYGLFHLTMSILSSSLSRILHFLGFESDRRLGLKCLYSVSKATTCMKAPIAVLCLLWYNLIAKPFFALDGSVPTSGIQDSERLMRKTTCLPKSSVLYLFFKGRISRLKGDLTGACDLYQDALFAAKGQKDLRLMCLYELGWCYLLQMNWGQALECFREVQKYSKWAPAYYHYIIGHWRLCLVCHGAIGDFDKASEHCLLATSVTRRKNNPIETFVVRKSKKILVLSKESKQRGRPRHRSLFRGSVLGGSMRRRTSECYTEDSCAKNGPMTKESQSRRKESTNSGSSSSYQTKMNQIFYQAHLLEVMYLWKALSACSSDLLGQMLSVCNQVETPELVALKCLLEGALFAHLNRTEISIQCLREALARCDACKDEKYIPAFASYELALLLLQNEETKHEGKIILLQAKDKYRGYDFENRLCMRVHAATKLFNLS